MLKRELKKVIALGLAVCMVMMCMFVVPPVEQCDGIDITPFGAGSPKVGDQG